MNVSGFNLLLKGGETPLLLALRLKHEQMALLLLECGADPSKANVEVKRCLIQLCLV